MDIRQATLNNLEKVFQVIQQTILEIYPHYYPEGAVQFFSAHHQREKIAVDVSAGHVWILRDEEATIGTVTVAGNEINRLFVLPAFQGKGFGSRLMDFAEELAFKNHAHIQLDASLPAQGMYLKRGYKVAEFHKVLCGNGDYLCYNVMRLEN